MTSKSKPYLMAHRGNSARCPENTLAAFRQAISDGADLIETDLHLTADDEFVCIHDSTVDRTTNGSGTVAGLTLAQIKTFSASYGRPEFESECVPTLRELIAILPDQVTLALELKTDRFLDPDIGRKLIHELDAGGVRSRTVVLSFSLARLHAVQQIAPQIPIGHITLSNPFPTAKVSMRGPYWPLLLLNPFYVWWAHRKGELVCPLDLTPETRIPFYRWLGCDAIMANDTTKVGQILKVFR